MNLKVVKNASWIVCCKVVESILGLVIGMITARYLGPANYGLISYASSIVAFVVPIMKLGLTSIAVQEFINSPDNEGAVIGTSLMMSICSAILSIISVMAFCYVANPNEPQTLMVCFLYSLSLIFQAGEIIQYWFQAKLQSKYPSIVTLIAYFIVSVYKVILLITEKSVELFAITHAIEALIISVILFVIYRRKSSSKLKISVSTGKRMFSRSKYYIISGLMISIFQHMDRVMLKTMLGASESGYYSAAITCIGITGFVFAAIIDSFRPSILESKNILKKDYEQKLIILFAIITIISIGQSLVMTLLAKPLILLMYGSAYEATIPLLQLAVWYCTFGYYGTVRNIWILAENKQKYLWIINLTGVVANFLLNYFLIPVFDAAGAAVATLLTQLIINVLLSFIIKPLRSVGMLMLRSWNPKYVLSYIKETKNRE